ncbi:hypothetical protein Salat_1109800 [Sesamum alatum]|uniref:Uncharacterized protein n=1 Tax=Sesamum alatum TaxID=300844 RepID=A0AAE2CT23_9LAMI|nr:hypothetical protein Salat_1109800 [Sesamum alatum]
MEIEAGLVELNRLEERIKRARPTLPTVQGTRFEKGPNVRRTPPGTLSGSHNVSQQNKGQSDKESEGNCKFSGRTRRTIDSCWRRLGKNWNQVGRPKIRARARAFALGGEEVTDPTTIIEDCHSITVMFRVSGEAEVELIGESLPSIMRIIFASKARKILRREGQ